MHEDPDIDILVFYQEYNLKFDLSTVFLFSAGFGE